MPPKPIRPPGGKPLSASPSKQVHPLPPKSSAIVVPSRVSVRPAWMKSTGLNQRPVKEPKQGWTREVSQVRPSYADILSKGKVLQAPPLTSPGASDPDPAVLHSQGQGQRQDSNALSQGSGPPESDAITEQPQRESTDHSGHDKGPRRSYHVRRAARASHYEEPSEKAWRDQQPPLVSPLEEPKYTDETIWTYKNWNVLDSPPFDPRRDKSGYTCRARWSKLWRDCQICMCCIGHGPKKDNPCACFTLPISHGAYLANAFSIVMSISSIIFEFCRISYPDAESEIRMSELHIFVCVMLLATSLLLFYGLDQFNITLCLPWILWQTTLTGLYFWFIETHSMELSHELTRGGQSVHSFSVLLGVPALVFHIYILWTVVAFVYNVKFKGLGPDTPNPYRLDPDNFLHLPDFHDFDEGHISYAQH